GFVALARFQPAVERLRDDPVEVRTVSFVGIRLPTLAFVDALCSLVAKFLRVPGEHRQVSALVVIDDIAAGILGARRRGDSEAGRGETGRENTRTRSTNERTAIERRFRRLRMGARTLAGHFEHPPREKTRATKTMGVRNAACRQRTDAVRSYATSEQMSSLKLTTTVGARGRRPRRRLLGYTGGGCGDR